MWKKNFIFAAAIICFIFLEFSLLIGTDGTLYFIYEDKDAMAAVIAGLETLAMVIAFSVVINSLNRAYDRTAGFDGKHKLFGRWCRTVLLAVLVTFFLIAVFELNSYQKVKTTGSQMQTMEMVLCFAAVAGAVWIYAANYHKTKDVGVRIHDLLHQNTTTRDRRYSLVIQACNVSDQKQIWARGTVHGEMKSGDEVTLLSPKETMYRFRIGGLQVNGERVNHAKNCMVTVFFSAAFEEKTDIPKYTVVSSVTPYCSKIADGVNNVENPYLCALLLDYNDFHTDSSYDALLYYSICHANYLIAGTVQNKARPGDIMDAPENRTDIGFSSVSQTGRTEPMLPVFTSWEGLKNWKDIMNGDKSITLILDFPHIVNIARNGFDAVVINPFGPRPFALSSAAIQEITNSKGYREDFILHKKERDPE